MVATAVVTTAAATATRSTTASALLMPRPSPPTATATPDTATPATSAGTTTERQLPTQPLPLHADFLELHDASFLRPSSPKATPTVTAAASKTLVPSSLSPSRPIPLSERRVKYTLPCTKRDEKQV